MLCVVLSCLDLSCLVSSCLIYSYFVWCCLMWFYDVLCGLMLSYVLLYPIVSPRLVFSCPGLSCLVFLLSFTTKEITVSWPSGKEITTQNNTEGTANLSNTYTNNHQIWDPFWVNFGALGHLGATLGSQRLKHTFQASFFTDFVSQWGPHWGPKNHTRGHRVAIWAPKDVFWRGLFTDLLFTWNLGPKTSTQSCLFWTRRRG